MQKGPLEPVASFSTVSRRKSSTGAAERSCQTPFFRPSSSKIKLHLPDNPHMWNKWPNDLQLFGPTCLMPPTTVLSDTPPPPTGKQMLILHVCLLSFFTTKGLTTHFLSHQNCVNRGGCCIFWCSFIKNFLLPPTPTTFSHAEECLNPLSLKPFPLACSFSCCVAASHGHQGSNG